MSLLELTWLRRGSTGRPMLEVEDLHVRVGLRRVIEGLSFVINEGDLVTLTGPNGCGKSSLLNAVAGLDPAVVEQGRMSIDGRPITKLPAYRRADLGVSYALQRDNVFPELTVEENIRLGLGRSATDRSGLPTDLEELAERLVTGGWLEPDPSVLEAKAHPAPRAADRAGLLSGGQKQLLAWGMSTLRPFRVLLADEPEAGLSRTLRVPSGRTCIVVTHNPSLYEEC